MRRWIGRWLMGVAVLHSVIGVVLFAAQLRGLVAAGLWDTVDVRDPRRGLAFWFLLAGVITALVGYLADWIERVPGSALPRALGWTLLMIALVGVILAPVSGFWLVFPAALGTLAQSRPGGRQASVV